MMHGTHSVTLTHCNVTHGTRSVTLTHCSVTHGTRNVTLAHCNMTHGTHNVKLDFLHFLGKGNLLMGYFKTYIAYRPLTVSTYLASNSYLQSNTTKCSMLAFTDFCDLH